SAMSAMAAREPTRRMGELWTSKQSLQCKDMDPAPPRAVQGPAYPMLGWSSAGVQGLHVEDEGGVRGDRAHAPAAIAEIGGNDEASLAADLHGGHAFVPALDHSAAPDGELEGLAA